MPTETETVTAVQFLTTLFQPGDTILFRPIETWNENNKKQSRVDYHGIVYHSLGGRVGEEWVEFPALTAAAVRRIQERSASEKTNTFFGVCPRFRHGSDQASYDLAWQIRTVRCLWSDVDDCDVPAALERCTKAGLPEPSLVVASGHGAHLYWLLSDPVQIDDAPEPDAVHTEFTDQGEGKKKKRRLYILNGQPEERQYLDVPTHRPVLSAKALAVQDTLAGIAAAIGGDHTTDLSRILRVPGTMNRKDERNGREPVPCTMVLCEPSRRYPFGLFDCFEKQSPQRLDRERIARVPLPRPKKISGVRIQDKFDSLIADCIAADPGTRSETDFALCCWAVERGFPADEIWQRACGAGKFAEAGRRYFDLTWTAACSHTREKIYTEAREKIARKRTASKEHVEGKDGLDHPVEKSDLIEADDDPHRLAKVNLEKYATRHDGRTLRFWRDEWYVWKANRYLRITERELRAKVTYSVREEFERLARDGATMANKSEGPPPIRQINLALISNVLQATSGMVCVSSDIEIGTWLPTRQPKHYVSMANGLVDVDAVLSDSDQPGEYLRPNTPEWFSTVSLPYAFDPTAGCQRFDGFLERNLEMDPERIKILQEWAGYLLLPNTNEQKFMVLEGEGGNGKSVYIAALTAMLGPENVATVPLEKFGDRFSLTSTLGKLLNAAGDCGDLDRAAEGDLKSFTAGDRMFFDRKGIAGINCAPTARLMLACNNRPRFGDRSQGIWRRMLLVPWEVEITKEERIRGMDKVEWWQTSGELPGIFRWALVGLARLRAQGGFTESEKMQAALQDYQEEMNPARVFLQENVELERDHQIKSKNLYRFYRKWCEEFGYHPMADKNFGREIRRRFPGVERKKTGTRSERFWIYEGIKFSQDEICGEKTEDANLF